MRREGRWLVGSGVASSTYPARCRPSRALARAEADGGYTVRLAAVDIGTGARTALTQIAAEGLEVRADTTADVEAQEPRARHAFGAQFAEVRVDLDTAEIRVPRLLGVFAAGQVVNPRTTRSQLIGGMTMGISMALHEESVLDARFGAYVNHDLAGYHVAADADVAEVEAVCIDEHDPDVNPVGAKGLGEIGIVGTAAAICNAVHHATGVRVRSLPIHLDELVHSRA